MSKMLMIYPNKCTGCRNCELACSFEKEESFRPGASRIRTLTWEREGFSVPLMCPLSKLLLSKLSIFLSLQESHKLESP